ncbi:MAG: amidohydrolase family protein, partial [Chloroflexota bacterium]
MLDVLIRGGRILDGAGNPWFRGDVGIQDGRIEAVGRQLPGPAKLEIDAAKLIVAPGFIDMHSHSDLRRLAEPACSDKISQGITTELLGQDGSSVAPVQPEQASARRRYLAGLLGNPPLDWDWPTFDAYLQALERTPGAPNACTLVTHGAVRSFVMSMDNRPATRDEIDCMCALVAEAMEAGAFGLSTGLIYVPCCYAAPEELSALYRVCAERGGILVSHVRNEADLVVESIEEMIGIGRQTGVPVHISHLKAIGPNNWGLMEPMLEHFSRTRSDGLDVTYDQYPYIAGSTILAAVLPAWAHEGGPDLLLGRLRETGQRQRIRQEIGEGIPGW